MKSFLADVDFMSGLTFDEQLNSLEKEYFETLIHKQKLLETLCNDYIDLISLREDADRFAASRDSTLVMLRDLSSIHYSS